MELKEFNLPKTNTTRRVSTKNAPFNSTWIINHTPHIRFTVDNYSCSKCESDTIGVSNDCLRGEQ